MRFSLAAVLPVVYLASSSFALPYVQQGAVVVDRAAVDSTANAVALINTLQANIRKQTDALSTLEPHTHTYIHTYIHLFFYLSLFSLLPFYLHRND